MADARYKRVVLKLSGEAMSGPGGGGIAPEAMASTVREIRPVLDMGVQVGVVVGAGNILRGRDLASNPHIRRVTADQMGMAATLVNALALQDALEAGGAPANVFSAVPFGTICHAFDRREAIARLEDGRAVVLAAGTGSPFFTTDTCAALRGLELGADIVLKATQVDGVYDSDPKNNPNATRCDRLTYRQVIEKRLAVMDLTAISMCMDGGLPIVVFQLSRAGNLAAAVRGEPVGTLVSAE